MLHTISMVDLVRDPNIEGRRRGEGLKDIVTLVVGPCASDRQGFFQVAATDKLVFTSLFSPLHFSHRFIVTAL